MPWGLGYEDLFIPCGRKRAEALCAMHTRIWEEQHTVREEMIA